MRNDIDWNQIKLAIDSGLISHTNFDVTTKLIESVAMLKLHNIKEFENKNYLKRKHCGTCTVVPLH